MSGKSRVRIAYALAAGGFMVLVACLRSDLLLQYGRDSLRQMRAGGMLGAKIAAENIFLCVLLYQTLRIISARARAVQDCAAFALALIAGFWAESWGTQSGLWSYYTGERPPLWIVPAWALGALVVERVASSAHKRARGTDKVYRAAYGSMLAAFVAIFWLFTRPMLSAYGILAAFLAALSLRPDYRRDFWILAAGAACVFLADLWGTTNHCWAYYTQTRGISGWAAGIAFGMLFDSALVLLCLKSARALSPWLENRVSRLEKRLPSLYNRGLGL